MRSSTARALHLAVLVLVCGLLTLVLLSAIAHRLPAPLEAFVRLLGACPYRAVVGSPCPLCGGTGAFVALLHGNLSEAVRSNPMAVFLAPLLLLQIPYRGLRLRTPQLSFKEEAALLASGAAIGGLLLLLAGV